VEIIDERRLILARDVVEIIEKEKTRAVRNLAELSEKILILEDIPLKHGNFLVSVLYFKAVLGALARTHIRLETRVGADSLRRKPGGQTGSILRGNLARCGPVRFVWFIEEGFEFGEKNTQLCS
jgi:hypothetical protein